MDCAEMTTLSPEANTTFRPASRPDAGFSITTDPLFRRLADSGIIGVFEGDESGRILDGNSAFLRMHGYSREELEAGLIRWDELTVPGYEEVNRRFGEQLAASGTTAPAELEYFRKDGSRIPVLVGLASLPGIADQIRALGFILDLTPQKQAQNDLRKSEEQFRQLAENIYEVFWIMDPAAGELVYVSPAYEHIWGQTCASLYANPESWMNSIHPDDRPGAEEVFRRQVEGEVLANEYRIVQPSGAVRWIRDRGFPVRDSTGRVVRLTGVAEDMTERKLSELRVLHQAMYDELTDLPNRRLFGERLRQTVAESRAGAVFFIDLDQFKLVNDLLGHDAGDQLLKEVALRLRGACGDSCLIARFGGDEFTLAAADFEDRDSVRRLGDKLIRCLNEPFKIAGQDVFVGASIGIALFPENGTDAHALKRDANLAMYEAKRAGKNQVRFFVPAFAAAALERLEMETRLRRALARSEFRLQFQPQFPAGASRPSRFEALIRWYPLDGEPVGPLKFIPLAEQNGLIVPIGNWVLQDACRQCAGWQTGILKGVGVAVNVSALQFACPDFLNIVARALESTGLSPDLLELELTESVFVNDVASSVLTLTKLRSIGVTIALDDFGTGYSSLGYLQNLPIDALKIDRSFLTEAESRPQGAAVLRCVIELAHALGLRVIGEGVELAADLDFLHRLGCDEIQGFLLGRPAFDVAFARFAAVQASPAAAAFLHGQPRDAIPGVPAADLQAVRALVSAVPERVRIGT